MAKQQKVKGSKLVVIEGPLNGTIVPLGNVQITIGRAPDSTLIIDDDYASSRHARIYPSEGSWVVEDLGSTNGTWIDRTRITSPVNGIVIKRAIEKGQTVAASLQSPELFVIAQNLSDMQVEAAIDESDVGRLRNGQKASFTVDAFPDEVFNGIVTQVRKAPIITNNVVTYDTRLDASNIIDIITGYDVIVDGADNFPSRYLLNDASVKLGIPVVHDLPAVGMHMREL